MHEGRVAKPIGRSQYCPTSTECSCGNSALHRAHHDRSGSHEVPRRLPFPPASANQMDNSVSTASEVNSGKRNCGRPVGRLHATCLSLAYGEDRPGIDQRVSGHSAAAASCGWFREPVQSDPCQVPLGRRYTSPPLRAACAVPGLQTRRCTFLQHSANRRVKKS